jgi:hypothetical protein
MIRLASVALDARAATRTHDARQLAAAARWIAGNALAASGLRVRACDDRTARACAVAAMAVPCDDPPSPAHRVEVHAPSITALLASLAAMPALVDPRTLRVRWRIALRALGVPLLDRPAADALAAGACVLTILPNTDCVA